MKTVLYGLLIVAIIAVAGLGLYGQGTIDTGVGEMSRLEAGRVYLRLMAREPVWPCGMGYVMGLLGTALVPLQHLVSAVRGEERWSEIPQNSREQVLGLVDGVLHETVACALPRPSDWTAELLGR